MSFQQPWQERSHYGGAYIFIHVRDGNRLRPRKARLPIHVGYYLPSTQVPAGGTVVHLIEQRLGSNPMFAKNPRLPFAELGELVVVFFEIGSLSVPDECKQ